MNWPALAAARLRDLIADTTTSDGDERQRPHKVAQNQLAHEAISAWVCFGFLFLGATPTAAALATIAVWGFAWEAVQYYRRPTVRVLRDWWLGDLPTSIVGAVAASAIWSGGSAAFFVVTPIVVMWPGVPAVIFGRTAAERAR
jgi:hypothetical protein